MYFFVAVFIMCDFPQKQKYDGTTDCLAPALNLTAALQSFLSHFEKNNKKCIYLIDLLYLLHLLCQIQYNFKVHASATSQDFYGVYQRQIVPESLKLYCTTTGNRSSEVNKNVFWVLTQVELAVFQRIQLGCFGRPWSL